MNSWPESATAARGRGPARMSAAIAASAATMEKVRRRDIRGSLASKTVDVYDDRAASICQEPSSDPQAPRPLAPSVALQALGPGHDLRPRGEAELVQDVLDVALHGPLADHQPGGDLPVGHALRDQLGHLLLARGELGYPRQVQLGRARCLAQRVGDRVLDGEPRAAPERRLELPIAQGAPGVALAVPVRCAEVPRSEHRVADRGPDPAGGAEEQGGEVGGTGGRRAPRQYLQREHHAQQILEAAPDAPRLPPRPRRLPPIV